MHELTGGKKKRMEHFSSDPFLNAGFPDGILKYALGAKSAGGSEAKNGRQRHTLMQGVYGSVNSNVYSTLTTSRDEMSI